MTQPNRCSGSGNDVELDDLVERLVVPCRFGIGGEGQIGETAGERPERGFQYDFGEVWTEAEVRAGSERGLTAGFAIDDETVGVLESPMRDSSAVTAIAAASARPS